MQNATITNVLRKLCIDIIIIIKQGYIKGKKKLNFRVY